MEKESAIVLLSGGLDSVTALYWAFQNYKIVGALSFNYGSKHNHLEIPLAIKHCKQLYIPHKTIELPFVNDLFQSNLLQSGGDIPEGHYESENMKQTVVPFRNGIMLSIAAGFAESIEAKYLIIGAHSGDHAIYPDCREDFMEHMSESICLGTYVNVKILRPFIEKRKEDIVIEGTKLGIDYSLTWSCYKGKEKHCGKCGTCNERIEAFSKAGVVDPTIYEQE